MTIKSCDYKKRQNLPITSDEDDNDVISGKGNQWNEGCDLADVIPNYGTAVSLI